MFKLLADENVAPRVVRELRREGWDVLSVYEKGLSGSSDEEILLFAKKQGRIILTHDKDFGNLIRQHLIRQPYQKHGGVILLRLRDQSPNSVLRHLAVFLRGIQSSKIKNRLVILQEGRARII